VGWSVLRVSPELCSERCGRTGGETASTNSLGFRGPDFSPSKPPDTFRIICLGGSSTFGFHNRDDETYPYSLQSLFNGDTRETRVEVINAGFPCYNTGSIVSLLENELMNYSPDLMTLYTGYNDTEWPLEITLVCWTVSWIEQHSIAYALLKDKLLKKKPVDARIYLKPVAHVLLLWFGEWILFRPGFRHLRKAWRRSGSVRDTL